MIEIARSGNGTIVFLTFRKSTGPASAGLGQGICAWLDRAVSIEEPNEIWLRFPDANVNVGVRRRGGADIVSYRTYGDNDRNAGNLLRLLTAMQRGTEFQIHAYREGSDRFIMSRFGP